MSKTHKNITVDIEVWDKLKRTYPSQLSSIINDFLHSKLRMVNKDLDGISIELERQKLAQIDEKMTDFLLKKQEIEEKIAIFEENLAKKEQEKLEKDKLEAEKCKTCSVCGGLKEKFAIVSEAGNVCKSCFLSQSDSPILKQIMREAVR